MNWSMRSRLILYRVDEGLMGRKAGVMNTVVVNKVRETAVAVGNSPWERTTESQPERSSALDSLI